ncbi:type II toxin-antitoxin system VapB family antitoxin [Aurantimonas sp. VKM B-3413]|uniref:type II toxin-antitoxin system VapB family antitoxin n=1 Tax=Aurantimonas sp. VKM B-3413 TaxID=2779401 RepID=UPI001E3FC62F|nr:type II toxin-antitoxin system VapB family antitoxin [Aurantimonas sp. VKM B-3413]MCB8837670.1 type II toxin-antitoxin system VapB family antitoxin [Aurantimonas sp. VKM B-3413]
MNYIWDILKEAAMPLYVKDPEVGELAERLARLKQTSKTEAVREALREALAAADPPKAPTFDAETRAYVDHALETARAVRQRYPPGGDGLPVTKDWIDSLYEDD